MSKFSETLLQEDDPELGKPSAGSILPYLPERAVDKVFWVGSSIPTLSADPAGGRTVVMPYRPIYNSVTGERSMTYHVCTLTKTEGTAVSVDQDLIPVISRGLSDRCTQDSKALQDLRAGKFTDLHGDENFEKWRCNHIFALITSLHKLQQSLPEEVVGMESLVIAHPWALDNVKNSLGSQSSMTIPISKVEFGIDPPCANSSSHPHLQATDHDTEVSMTEPLSEQSQPESFVVPTNGGGMLEEQQECSLTEGTPPLDHGADSAKIPQTLGDSMDISVSPVEEDITSGVELGTPWNTEDAQMPLIPQFIAQDCTEALTHRTEVDLPSSSVEGDSRAAEMRLEETSGNDEVEQKKRPRRVSRLPARYR